MIDSPQILEAKNCRALFSNGRRGHTTDCICAKPSMLKLLWCQDYYDDAENVQASSPVLAFIAQDEVSHNIRSFERNLTFA